MTISDVARQAGVSASTVSNVLNGRPGAMSPETLQRVKDAIRALNYRPSNAARGLVTRRSATIGLILAEIETPLFLQALTVLEPIARAAGYNLLLCSARNVDDERDALHLLLEKDVDGVILLSTSQYVEDDHLAELIDGDKPVLLVNRATKLEGFDRINWDNAGGVTAAVEYLVQLGHVGIGFLQGPAQRRSSAERLAGYQTGLARSSLPFREEYIGLGDFTAPVDGWRASTEKLLGLAQRPTAIIAADDIVAAVVMKTVQACGLDVPGDVAVIGIDDQPFCTYLNPALSTVRLPVAEAGALAVQMLLDRLMGERQVPQDMLLPCPLVVRDSCGPVVRHGAAKSERELA